MPWNRGSGADTCPKKVRGLLGRQVLGADRVISALNGRLVGAETVAVTAAPPLHRRLLRILDVLHHAGLLEFSAYLLATVTSFKFTLWYSDRKEIIASRAWKDVRLSRSEKAFLILAFVLLLCAGFVESYGIIHLKG